MAGLGVEVCPERLTGYIVWRSVMSVRRLGLMLVALLLVAAPATAAEPAPQVTDECGDAGTWGEWNGDSMEFEESRPHLDIASGRIAGLYDEAGTFNGFTAAATMCGDVSATEGGYNVSWAYGDRCFGSVSWTLSARQRPDETGIYGHLQAASMGRAVVSEDCYRASSSPLEDSVETIYSVALPAEAVVFDGDTVTFTVAASLLPEAAAPRLAAGTEWANVGVITMDQGPSMWAGYFDTQGNRGNLYVRTDLALGGDSYVVGEDA
jgi:hypothetical protein